MKNSGGKPKRAKGGKVTASAPDDDVRFGKLRLAFDGEAGITGARMFGSSGLKTQGRVFAMVVKDDLVVKLPAGRVKALMDAGVGKPFDPGHGKVMKEWIAVGESHGKKWLSLAKEARDFVDSL